MPTFANSAATESARHHRVLLGLKVGYMLGSGDPAHQGQLVAAAPCAACGEAASLPHMNCANIDCNKLFLACDRHKVGPTVCWYPKLYYAKLWLLQLVFVQEAVIFCYP